MVLCLFFTEYLTTVFSPAKIYILMFKDLVRNLNGYVRRKFEVDLG